MPVNNWIPVAQNFTQFLDRQTQRKRKLVQQGMLQVLPSYINQQLSGVKSKEELYQKIPELSAQMFAIDPEVGAQATHIANSYGQIKLNEIQERESEDKAKQNVNVLKDTFGTVNVMHQGKSVPFASLIDKLSPTMKAEDLARFGETILKAGQVKKETMMGILNGKPVLTQYQIGPNGEAVDKPKQYYINRKSRTLDDISTKDIENLTMDAEGTTQLSKFELGQYERQQSLGNQLYADRIRRERELEFPKAIPYTLSTGKTGLGTLRYKKNDKGEYVPEILNEKGENVTEQIISNRIFAGSVKQQLGNYSEKDYYGKASHSAGYLINQLAMTDIFDEDRLAKVIGAENMKQYKMGKDLRSLGFSDVDILHNLARTSGRGFDKELVEKLGLDKPDSELSATEKERKQGIKEFWNQFWTNWDNYRKFGQFNTQRGSEYLQGQTGNTNTPTKKGAFD